MIKFQVIALFSLLLGISNASAQSMQLSLTPSQYNGYNISCFGSRDGSINLTVNGGTAPYTFIWSNGATTEDLTNISEGYYHVIVKDRNGAVIETSITLTAPEPLAMDFIVSSYPNGYNISCFDCFNGSIILFATGGTGVYTYTWDDGSALQDRFNLGEGNYTVTIEDNNQCVLRPENFYLTAPTRSDWTLTGNEGLVDSINFIGTSDSTNLNLKANNQTLLKLNADGQIELPNISPGMLFLDETGKIKTNNGVSPAPCSFASISSPAWSSLNNGLLYTCPIYRVGIGTYNVPSTTKLKVTGNSWFDGPVGIGIDITTANLQAGTNAYQFMVNGKMGAGEIYCSVGNPWPDYVFSDTYELMPLKELKEYIKVNKHLPGVPSAAEMQSSGVNVYEQLAKAYEKIEELYLHLIELEEKVQNLVSNED